MDSIKLFQVCEGLIFINGDEGIEADTLAKLLEVSKQEIEDTLLEIAEYYLDDKHGIELVNYGGVYKFVSKALIHEIGRASCRERV